MERQAENFASPGGWLRKHAGTVLLALTGAILAFLCTTGQPDGLTTYVLFLFVLSASVTARFLGRLVRLPDFGPAFAVGGFVMLLERTSHLYGPDFVSVETRGMIAPWRVGGIALLLWLTWAIRWARGRGFWRQFASASGIAWGGLASMVLATLMHQGPPRDWWPKLPVAVAFMGAVLPVVFFLAWIPCWSLGRLGCRLRACGKQESAAPIEFASRVKRYLTRPAEPRDPRQWQFTVRPILLLIMAVSVGLSWFRIKQEQVRWQQEAVEALREHGEVHFLAPDSWAEVKGAHWLRESLGVELFETAQITLSEPEMTFLEGEKASHAKLAHLAAFCSDVDLRLLDGFDDSVMPFIDSTPRLMRFTAIQTEISDAGLAHLRSHTQLEQLVLRAAPITNAGLEHLSGLCNLYWLDLGSNRRVTDAGLIHLEKLARLRGLRLCQTTINGRGLVHLQSMQDLVLLDLSGTAITDNGLQYLPELKNLAALDLHSTRISNAGLRRVAHIGSLESLSLSNTAVSDDGLAILQRMRNLHEIDLQYTRVTDQGLRYLTQLSHLTRVDLRNTQVSPEAVDLLQQHDDPFTRVMVYTDGIDE